MTENSPLLEGNKLLEEERKGTLTLFKESILMMGQISKDLWISYIVVFAQCFMLDSIIITVP